MDFLTSEMDMTFLIVSSIHIHLVHLTEFAQEVVRWAIREVVR